MHPSRAVDLLRHRLDELDSLQSTGQAFSVWREQTETTLRRALPSGHPAQEKFDQVYWTAPVINNPPAEARAFISGKEQTTAVLQAAIYELDELSDDQDVPVVLSVEEVRKVERVVDEFNKALDEGELDSLDRDDLAEAQAEVHTLNDQIRSPRPKRVVVGACLRFLQDLVKPVLAGAAGVGLVNAIDMATKLIH